MITVCEARWGPGATRGPLCKVHDFLAVHLKLVQNNIKCKLIEKNEHSHAVLVCINMFLSLDANIMDRERKHALWKQGIVGISMEI